MRIRISTFRAVLLVAVVFLAGCDALLDREPQQSISEETALNSPQNVEAALRGAYDVMSNSDLFGGQFYMSPDLLADDGDLNWTGTFAAPREIWNKNILVDNGFIEDTWIDAYQGINVANNVLSALDVFEGQDRRARVEGEARFLRGLFYFELARLWGKPYDSGDPGSIPAVPLVLDPTREINEDSNVPRSSLAEVYAQALDDLSAARDLLPPSNDPYADTYAASSVLSRVYLMQGAYEEAAAEADRVIASGEFELADDFAGAFNNTDDVAEYVFSVQVSSQDGANELNLFYGSIENNGRGDINILEAHLDDYEDDDTRGDFFYVDGTGALRTSKWAGSTAEGVNVPVIRLAEMYLTRAEANLRAGTTVGAPPVDDINAVRNRAGLDDFSSVTVEDVLRERMLELMFEGHLLHDLQRTGRPVGDIPYDADRLTYPIPQRELDANPELTQNPGYGS